MFDTLKKLKYGARVLLSRGGGEPETIAVAGSATHGQAAPAHALLTDGERKQRPLPRGHRHAACFGDDVVGPDGVGMMIEQVGHAVSAGRFFVGNGGEDQGASRSEPVGGQSATGDGHRGREVEHVDGATSPHEAVFHVGGEGIMTPATTLGGNHVGMAEKQQCGCPAIGALDSREEADAAGRR